MSHAILPSRREFLARSLKLGSLTALSTLTDFPLVMRQALAQSGLGRNGRKLIFIFLRGGNDSLNSLIPIQDDGYAPSRPVIGIAKDPAQDYSATGPADFPASGGTKATFDYTYGIRTGNGFAALHPALKFLVPVHNAGELALVHRVGYPHQSRSHFDSQIYWETGNPNDHLSRDGIFYRTLVESGLANTSPLTGVSFQSSLPMILRGSKAAMTNLSDTGRYNLLGIPNTTAGNNKADAALRAAMGIPFPEKRDRDLLQLQYENLSNTLSIFASLDFSEAGNTYTDTENTDGDTAPYNLFPTTNAKNGGYSMHNNDTTRYVVSPGSYDFFNRLKAAAIVLNKTDALIAGTSLDGFDTHSNQGAASGSHANLMKTIGWAMYGLKRYFTKHADKANWQNVTVVTLSEFGRTSIQNSDGGTDHAEAGVMFVAGGAVKGHGRSTSGHGVFGLSPADKFNGVAIPWTTGTTKAGSMFAQGGRYLKRAVDYRSVLGELIRDHLGATQAQLNRIIPGYLDPAENLQSGGICGIDAARIFGELDLV